MFDWYDYFTLALELRERDDEACKRSAVSRAYYAMFCNARNALEFRGEFDRRESGSHHRDIWNHFGLGPDRERRRIGELGHRLREARRQADYDDEIPNLCSVVEGAMITANQLMAALRGL